MAEKAIKLTIKAGEATPAPPIGSTLAPQGIKIVDFCKQFNDRTKQFEKGTPIPTKIFVNKKAKTFTFDISQPPASYLLLKAANVTGGSGVPNKQKVGYLTYAQVEQIAKQKLPDLNTGDIAVAVRTLMGTARSMGIDVRGDE
jgi:large subunit ribosomal protein L11